MHGQRHVIEGHPRVKFMKSKTILRVSSIFVHNSNNPPGRFSSLLFRGFLVLQNIIPDVRQGVRAR
jgi:hypothetical protein